MSNLVRPTAVIASWTANECSCNRVWTLARENESEDTVSPAMAHGSLCTTA